MSSTAALKACKAVSLNKLVPVKGSVLVRHETVQENLLLKTSSSEPFSVAISDQSCNTSRNTKSTENKEIATYNHGYWLGREIALATYGSVHEGRSVKRDCHDIWKVSDELLAIKKMLLSSIKEGRKRNAFKKDPENECAAMQILQSYFDDGLSTEEAIKQTSLIIPYDCAHDGQYLYIVMRHVGENLCSSFLTLETKSESYCRSIFSQLLVALENFLKAGLCHRGVCLESVMIDDAENVTLIDFGLSSTRGLSKVRVGEKFQYMSPQLYNCKNVDAHENDVWGAATILFYMLTGYIAWDRPTELDINFRTHSHHQLITTTNFSGLSENAVNLLQGMFALDPKDRLTIEQIRNHAWMTTQSNDSSPDYKTTDCTPNKETDNNIAVIRHTSSADGDMEVEAVYRERQHSPHLSSGIDEIDEEGIEEKNKVLGLPQ